MLATGSSRNGSSSLFSDSDGQPESRMQAWSPVHTASSTPKRGASTRRPSRMAACRNGLSRRDQDKDGLTNLRERLRAFFGPQAELQLSPAEPHGLRAEIVFTPTADR